MARKQKDPEPIEADGYEGAVETEEEAAEKDAESNAYPDGALVDDVSAYPDAEITGEDTQETLNAAETSEGEEADEEAVVEEGDWLEGTAVEPEELQEMQQKADSGSFMAQGQKKKFSFDFRDVEDGPPKLDPGIYHAVLLDVDQENAKTSGLPQFVWQFAVTKGPKKGFKMKFWTSLSQDARWKAAQTMKALGVKAAGSVGELDADRVIGQPAKIEVYMDDYQGEPRSKIKTVHAPDAESIQARDEWKRSVAGQG